MFYTIDNIIDYCSQGHRKKKLLPESILMKKQNAKYAHREKKQKRKISKATHQGEQKPHAHLESTQS